MHFSIPDTQDLNEGNGSSFIGYNIHINGVFHCTVRYKQLLSLHEHLKKEFNNNNNNGQKIINNNNVPIFPPKKLLPLTNAQLEERRILLEKYIQTIGQDSKLINSKFVYGFFLCAQQESSCFNNIIQKDLIQDIYLMNNCQIKIRSSTYDNTELILSKALKEINLPLKYKRYFSIYLMTTTSSSDNSVVPSNNEDIIILRKLLDFESPYLTQQFIKSPTKIYIRKNYWDKNYDKELMLDPIALNLLYIETMSDVENGWIMGLNEKKRQLIKLKQNLQKRDYIEYAQKLKYYGFVQFKSCFCDYPQPKSRVIVCIGDEELNLRILNSSTTPSSTNTIKEGIFKVTRMRCWRITTNNNNNHHNNIGKTDVSSLELSFEYLMSKNKLQWITISSDQAIFMSSCLQSLVDELLMKKHGSIHHFPVENSWEKIPYMKRDGSYQMFECGSLNSALDDDLDEETPNYSIKTLQNNFSTVSFKNGREFVENHAFDGIGDDDL